MSVVMEAMEGPAGAAVAVTPTAVIALRLGAAAVMGAVIGWERSRCQKPAGARTMIMIAAGAAAFTLLGEELLAARLGVPGITTDPTRVLAYVISGVGFLGAGTILHSKKTISGLTTAATVWAVAALGAACGVGELRLAGMVFVLVALTLLVPHLFWKLGELEFDSGEEAHQDDEHPPARVARVRERRAVG